MKIMNKSGLNISSIKEWEINSPPANKVLHWQKGKSAYELARSWLGGGQPQMPIALTELLHSHAELQGFEAEWAVPEYETKLDQFRGKGRNHDLIIIGTVNSKRTLIAVEAKVDESFGDLVHVDEIRSIKNKPNSKASERIRQLTQAVLGNKDAEGLRYQLIHAVAGTVIEARTQEALQAVFVICEFVPATGKTKKAKQNEADYQFFLKQLVGIENQKGKLIGPIILPGGGMVPADMPLYIGKIEIEI